MPQSIPNAKGLTHERTLKTVADSQSATTTVIHIPHASTTIPPDELDLFVLHAESLVSEVRRMTDAYTDELFDLDDDLACRLVFPISRLVVDPERFANDEQEIMAQRGMGVLYNKTSDGADLRRPLSMMERQQMLDRYYWPHHRKLESLVRGCLDAHDYCLVIDAHSFPSVRLPYELDTSPERPDICIGTDPDHTPSWLADEAEMLTAKHGWSVKRDSPFSGSIVPTTFYRRDKRVLSIMIEVNRGLYMDESSGHKRAEFSKVRERLHAVCRGLIDSAVTQHA